MTTRPTAIPELDERMSLIKRPDSFGYKLLAITNGPVI